MLIEKHVRASSHMNKTRANMRHFLTCIKFFHQFEKKSSNSNLPLSIFRMSIIADFLNPYYTHRGNDKRWQK
ncbi:hypothetical protein D5F24_21090 [Shigella flexneri]|nr:hypothetical protein BS654_10990 [Shigella flexneri 4c]ASQ63245.1 hypothetical protein BS647_16910 [Shigella flexneri 1a]EAA0506816.1 hypothetical protein [Shigella flexneri]OUZ56154.1 hypothetical protein CBL27_23160 [Shigella sonnei]ASQ60294.1 hypothetical protein BS653_06460 [Shigella flexneri 4c]